ncbi:MAG: tetratricopeptide repeat protein [Holophagales bacterium]|nr:tetratricopeptide repeat protein [Holophagales bacterium]
MVGTPRGLRPHDILRPRVCGLLVALVASGCGGPAREAPALPEIPPPSDLEQLDRSVREQFAATRSRFEERRGQAGRVGEAGAEVGRAYGELGAWYHAYGFHTQAARAYGVAAELDSEEPRWSYLLATVHRQEGRWQEALDGFSRVLAAAEPEPYAPALLWSASIELDLHRLEQARVLFARALEHGGGALALHGLAKVALEEGRGEDALPLLERALELEPDASVLVYAAARAHLAAGRRERAEALLERLPEDNRHQRPLTVADPWLHWVESLASGVIHHVRAGMAARREGRLGRAVEHFQRAVAADERNLEARLQLARTWTELNRPAEARRSLKLALERFPDEIRVRFQLARVSLQLGRLTEVESHLDRMLAADPGHVGARLLRAELAFHQGRGEEALVALAALRRESPGDADVARAHALGLEAMGRREAALESLREDLERLPGDPGLTALAARLEGGG